MNEIISINNVSLINRLLTAFTKKHSTTMLKGLPAENQALNSACLVGPSTSITVEVLHFS